MHHAVIVVVTVIIVVKSLKVLDNFVVGSFALL